ncbi:hypothetical protein OROHE_020024 [Orobanche hederae]
MTSTCCFNIPYLVICQMLKASKVGYFAYGMFLTELFEHFKINLSAQPSMNVTYVISGKCLKIPVSLSDFLPYGHAPKKSGLVDIKLSGNMSSRDIIKEVNELKSLQDHSHKDLKADLLKLSGKLSAQSTILDSLSNSVVKMKGKVAFLDMKREKQEWKVDRALAIQVKSDQKHENDEDQPMIDVRVSNESVPTVEQLLNDSQGVSNSSQLSDLDMFHMDVMNF